MSYLKTVMNRKQTSQSQPIPGSKQVRNSAGGYVFEVNDWVRMDRFLILGSEGGSYYAGEQKLTLENAQAVQRAILADGVRAVNRIVEISEGGRVPKADPAIFALAMAAAQGDASTRRAALAVLPRVARTGTHLFHFAQYVDGMRGWGRGLRSAVGRWYSDKPVGELAYQMIKYQARDGWSHRDLLRLSHPAPDSDERRILFHWATQGWESVGDDPHSVDALRQVWASERIKRATTAREAARLVADYRLPRESVPTEWLNEMIVWEALLQDMPLTAAIRNLATMTRNGLLAPNSEATQKVIGMLGDERRLRSARVHPIAVLSALKTYASGRGVRGQHTWTPVAKIVDALDAAFYASFGNVKPTGKRWMLALDVSGSMGTCEVAGVPGLSPRVASAAMAMVTAATEPQHEFVAFASGGWSLNGADLKARTTSGFPVSAYPGGLGIAPLSISPRQRLDDVLKITNGLPFGGTDTSLPMIYAMERKRPVDVFVVLTDSETWAGGVHPVQALAQYRQRMGIPAKLIVVGMVSNGFSIADPEDGGMMDVVGFDTATPQLMSDFAVQ